MIVDCFTFYNELKMLLFRLDYLWDTVDYFVIVEATTTHAGHPKPLFFKDNEAMFGKYISKIVHVVVEDMPQNADAWVPETFQRDCIDRGIKTLSLTDNDLILISDVDEIPNKHTIHSLRVNIPETVCSLDQYMYYYNLSGRVHIPWTHAKIVTYKIYKAEGSRPNSIRHHNPVQLIQNGGWHFSYFGSPEFIANKIKNFAHQEFNSPDFTDIDNIKRRIENNTDIYDRNWVTVVNCPFDTTTLPENYEMLLDV